MKMHADELETNASLVRRMLEAQFPEWAALPIAPVPSSGTVLVRESRGWPSAVLGEYG